MNSSDLIPGCQHFTWKDALYLPKWNVCHIPSDAEQQNLIKVFNKLELVREYLNSPIIVHVAIRPILNNPSSSHHGEDYNALIGGATHSSHISGCAIDWHPTNLTCDDARTQLISKLEEYNIRMENLPGSGWVHVDVFPVINTRFFKP